MPQQKALLKSHDLKSLSDQNQTDQTQATTLLCGIKEREIKISNKLMEMFEIDTKALKSRIINNFLKNYTELSRQDSIGQICKNSLVKSICNQIAESAKYEDSNEEQLEEIRNRKYDISRDDARSLSDKYLKALNEFLASYGVHINLVSLTSYPKLYINIFAIG